MTRIIRMTIPRAPRPTREEWEAEERRWAQDLIDTGENTRWSYDTFGQPSYTDADEEEIDTLTPEVIKVVRRACGRAERDLREKHPAAGVVARGIESPSPFTMEVVERWYAAKDALAGADKDAFEDLVVLRHVRDHLRKDRWYSVTEWMGAWEFDRWPQGYELPASPALDRLRALHAEGIQRRYDTNVAKGRQMLADLESGAAWERELERRARADEMDRGSW
jgi:hypothetical protein